MSVNGEVKVWDLPPGKFNQVLQNPGMDLGEPDRIDEPAQLIFTPMGVNDVAHAKERSKIQSERAKKAHRAKKAIIDLQLFREAKAAGKTNIEIAAQYGIKRRTLQSYIAKWKEEGDL